MNEISGGGRNRPQRSCYSCYLYVSSGVVDKQVDIKKMKTKTSLKTNQLRHFQKYMKVVLLTK